MTQLDRIVQTLVIINVGWSN